MLDTVTLELAAADDLVTLLNDVVAVLQWDVATADSREAAQARVSIKRRIRTMQDRYRLIINERAMSDFGAWA